MTNEDLERLIKVLDGTQFEIENRADGYVWVSLKDPWEGVEFVECITYKAFNFKEGEICRLARGRDINGIICIYNEGNTLSSVYICHGAEIWFQPCTKESYVNQLKAKAFELYGDIQDLDRFQEPNGNTDTYRAVDNFVNPEWDYIKNHDELFFYSILLYKEGQWAKKLPKRIEVSILSIVTEDNEAALEKCKSIGEEAIFDYMSKCLEKLLNDEVD
jgi:hypothetical protein